ncbi:MAG: hypothetical protein NZM11_07365 [Anaerolineales bacterium]|nr:hypothetical protein [Anaerolineales bacterium]
MRPWKVISWLVGVLLLSGSVGLNISSARTTSQTQSLEPGTTLTLTCPTRITLVRSADRKTLTVTCAPLATPRPTQVATQTQPAPSATAQPTSTPVTPTNTPETPAATPTPTPTEHHHHYPTSTPSTPGVTPTPSSTQPPASGQLCPDWYHNPHEWHPPVDPATGCHYGHEHGDAPPAWVQSSRWPAMFSHPGNTPNENLLKHTSFKGFTLRDDGIDLYVIMHLDTNPNGHASRFHSYQAWARDASGGISYWDLWADFGEGNNTGPNVRWDENCGGNTEIRPIMAVVYPQCNLTFESWYSRAGAPGWGWDFGFNVKPQYYNGPQPGVSSNPDLSAMSTWLPTGQWNDVRRIEAAWYAFRPHPTGTFYSTQWGEIVSGPNDPRCGTQRTIGSRTYQVLCIEQYIAPTMTTFSFPGNSIQKEYNFTGVRLPN